MDRLVIAADEPSALDVRQLLGVHLEFAHAHSPREDVHALDVSDLLAENVSFFSAREAGTLAGVGALKQLDESHGELKSIHTAAWARRRGVGRAIVAHLIRVARVRSYRRVSLETGTMEGFAASRALYTSMGFEVCEPFAAYTANANSVCMTVELSSRTS